MGIIWWAGEKWRRGMDVLSFASSASNAHAARPTVSMIAGSRAWIEVRAGRRQAVHPAARPEDRRSAALGPCAVPGWPAPCRQHHRAMAAVQLAILR